MKLGSIQILNGPLCGQKYKFCRSISFGRQTGNSLRLLDPKVSRTHALIDVKREGFIVKDLGSKNGNYVNGIRVVRCALRKNDLVHVGGVKILFTE